MNPHLLVEDRRFRQADREALWSVALTAGYFLWWFGFAYGLGSGPDAGTRLLWGLPVWFTASCVLGGPVFLIAVAWVVRRVFVDLPLDPWEETSR
ncbi:YhdT family protein [Aminomonas paucivorans]|uniref:DUF997 family protein n=1 Tax=Aminomonas paucivorans DSM 12260 TaxID=584708 RepID=E3D014_9BACT|nr:YhdT family protein [Aminomonas paucivorans]EFQ22946.1 protein of unknown function DUF997 [Aminomonas paucivorans DSM 12260]